MASAFISIIVNVAAAGTRVQLSSTPLLASQIVVKGRTSNTDKIYLGGDTVSSANGYVLVAGEPFSIPNVDPSRLDLANIYIDSAVNGEGVHVMYMPR